MPKWRQPSLPKFRQTIGVVTRSLSCAKYKDITGQVLQPPTLPMLAVGVLLQYRVGLADRQRGLAARDLSPSSARLRCGMLAQE